jgi:hypothetical protein
MHSLHQPLKTLIESETLNALRQQQQTSREMEFSSQGKKGGILPCLFGCAGEQDDLSHYLVCPHLFTLWSFLTNLNVSEMPLIRWGLINPCTHNLNAIACIFSGYHAVRRRFKSINQFFEYKQSELSSAQLCCARGVFADAFTLEAKELGISTRKFTLPSFFRFYACA